LLLGLTCPSLRRSPSPTLNAVSRRTQSAGRKRNHFPLFRRNPKYLRNPLQPQPLCLRHPLGQHDHRKQRQPTIQKVRPASTLTQKVRRRKSNHEIRRPIHPLLYRTRPCAVPIRDNLGGIEFSDDGPGRGECGDDDVNGGDGNVFRWTAGEADGAIGEWFAVLGVEGTEC
jgi:hypothetical protein